MKGPYTSPRPLRRSLFYLCEWPIDLSRPLRRSLFYLYEGPIYLSKASWKKFVLSIWSLEGLLEGICSTYVKGPYTSLKPLRRSLFWAHIPLQDLLEGVCSAYMKGPYTSPRPLGRSLFYLYEGPSDLKSLLVYRSLETCLEEPTKNLLKRNLFYLYEGPKDFQKPLRRSLFYLYERPIYLSKAS